MALDRGGVGPSSTAARLGDASQLPPRNGEWMTVDEAADYLRYPTREALYQAVRRGRVPACRIGRSLRFSKVSLEGLLSSSACPPR